MSGGGGGGGNKLPTFHAESKSAKNQIPLCLVWGCRGGGGEGNPGNKIPTFDAESKSAKNQISLCLVGGIQGTNFQLLMPSLDLLKTKFSYVQ